MHLRKDYGSSGPRIFQNASQRNAQLMARGRVMRLGEGEDASAPSWAAGLLDFAKSAVGLVNQQRAFDQQLQVARQTNVPVSQVQAQAARPASTGVNMGRIALLGAAGVLSVMLLKSVMSRR